jgi:hypothetical protein
MTDPIETTDLPYHAKAVEIMSRQCCRSCKAVGDTCECEAEGGIRIAYPISGVDLVSAIAAALEAERLEERERCAAISDLERDSKIEAAQKFEQGSRERADMYICSVTANSISVLIRNGSA